MRSIKTTIILIGMFAATLSQSLLANETIPVQTKADCMEGSLAEFGRYIGNWDIADSSLSAETGKWEPGAGAKWNFVCLGGIAVQDFWLPAGGSVGTNLRTWNSDTNSWDIAWAVTGLSGFAHIEAKMNASGNIVMQWRSPVPSPARRITFFPPDDAGWDWKMEIAQGGEGNWLEVYRIRATPAQQ